MPIDKRLFNGLLNSDDTDHLIRPDEYINCENMRFGTTDTGEVGNMESIGSTVLIPFTFPVAPPYGSCTPVTIVGSPNLPDVYETSAYSYNITLGGTAPFVLSNIVKPAWMTVVVSGSTVSLTGTPGSSDAGTASVSFTVTNCSGVTSTTFADTFTVIDYSPPAGNRSITYNLNGQNGFGIRSTWRQSGVVIHSGGIISGGSSPITTPNALNEQTYQVNVGGEPIEFLLINVIWTGGSQTIPLNAFGESATYTITVLGNVTVEYN